LNASHRIRYVVLLAAILAALFAQFFPGYVAAQTSNWDIVVDTSINEGAITGTLSNVNQGVEEVSGNIVLDNNTALWWKVYLTEVPEDKVDVGTSGLFFDEVEDKYYFYLAPLGSSDSDALPTLPPSVTFHEVGSGLFFLADRTIVSGYGALILQVAEIALIALTGSGVPTSAVTLVLNSLNAPPFLTIAEGLAETPVNFWKLAEGLGGIAHSSLALNQLQYVLAHLGVSMTISQIQQVFVFWSIVQELRIIYDTLTCPVADNVMFQAIESDDEPIIADIDCFPSSGPVPLTVNFDASGSYSPQYPIVSYDWDFGDDEYGTGITETHTYYQAGDYTVTLTITDDHSRQSIATRTIIVWPTGIQVTAGAEQFNLIFTAEESPSIVAYSWDFGDGNRSEDRIASNTYSGPGEYIVSLCLGLDTGDPTEDWVAWIGRDAIRVFLQTDSTPAGWSFTVDRYDDAPDRIMVDGIIVEDADEVWTNTLVASTDLDLVAQAVMPHIISEYGDSLSTLDLVSSDDLDAVATTVSPRVTFEYADSSAPLMLAHSAELAQVASAVTPRVVVEYSDVIHHPDLQYSIGLDQPAALVSPRIIVEYANVIFDTIMTSPNIDSEVTVDISVVLQGGSRPPEAWEIPITIKFFSPGADVMTDTEIHECNCTTTKSDGTATCQCVDVVPGTYDITAQASNCPECTEGNCVLMNVRQSVGISAPSTSVDMGTLLAGDANCDGIINISDFGILAVAYMCTEGEPCYDCRADFDCNGIINISDFGLLAVNYMKISPIDIS
jgi:PKD repeat protein